MSEQNLFDMYFKYVRNTEPPAIFHRWSLIASVGAMLGRQYWLPFGSSRLFPNQYVMFVGDPGTRKSTAIKKAARLIRLAGFEKFSAQKTSMEKFLLDSQDDDTDSEGYDAHEAHKGGRKKDAIDMLAELKLKFDGDGSSEDVPREMFIAADEANNFLGSANIAFQSLLGELWDWDEPTACYKQRLKSSKSVAIYQPTISILAGNTPSSFADCFPLASIGQGFMSRLILVHADCTGKKITFPAADDPEEIAAIVQYLQRIRSLCVGPATLTPEAESAMDLIYKGWTDMEDQRFKHYSSRRFTHLIKLCLIVSACRCSTQIAIQDVLQANTVLAWAETTMPKAIGELGKSKNAEAANKIMQFLYSATEAKTSSELWKVVQMDLSSITDLGVLLMNLQQADKIQIVPKGHGAKEGYLAKQKQMSRNMPFTNFEILKGRETS